jgi:hypothetical protein
MVNNMGGSSDWNNNILNGAQSGTRERINQDDSFYVLFPDAAVGEERVLDYEFGEDELLAICSPELYPPEEIGSTKHGSYTAEWTDGSSQEGNITVLVDHPSNFFDFEEDYDWLDRSSFDQNYNPWTNAKIGVTGDTYSENTQGSEIRVSERETQPVRSDLDTVFSNYDGGSVLED